MAIFDQENKNEISSCKFFSILGHQTLDPDPESGSALNQCGSETLIHWCILSCEYLCELEKIRNGLNEILRGLGKTNL
jgi:hypothetical protein